MAAIHRSRTGLALLRVMTLATMSLLAPAAGAEDSAAIEARQTDSRAEYERVLHEMSLSSERAEKLAAEIATVKKDHATITAALIQAAKTEKKLGQDIEDITDRLDDLKKRREGIHKSLTARRGVLAEVLGALQRMGLNPPPALLVRPEDALSSVRSAILLGAVVPELRSETETLLADLNELNNLTASIEAERQRLSATVGEQLSEKQRLSLLLVEKSRLQGESEAALVGEKEKSAALAAKAGSLKDLIASLEKDIIGARSAEEQARREEDERAKREAALAAMPAAEHTELAETAPFSQMQGKLALPVAGRVARRFGHDDSNGGVMLGDMVATQSEAIVTAPADGSVLYAGPFRSYGQLLILNAGDGYHVVLAGMGRISVSTGQSVLAGEPVGVMGEAKVASATASGIGNAGPELYVEFRKDGKPVDPAPWWAVRLSGRTANGT
jgi:septal ring factor EnvC (AmiA/AmiB activator)